MSEGEPVVIAIDINVDAWKVSQAQEFRRVVGVNAEYALVSVQRAWNAAAEEMRETFGEAMDADGWRPPDDFVPLAILNVDPGYLLGFAWIGHRRDHPDDVFDVWADSVPIGRLNEAFYQAMNAVIEEQRRVPLNRARRRSNGHRSATGSPSASPSTGPLVTSTTSPSESSAEPSTS